MAFPGSSKSKNRYVVEGHGEYAAALDIHRKRSYKKD